MQLDEVGEVRRSRDVSVEEDEITTMKPESAYPRGSEQRFCIASEMVGHHSFCQIKGDGGLEDPVIRKEGH